MLLTVSTSKSKSKHKGKNTNRKKDIMGYTHNFQATLTPEVYADAVKLIEESPVILGDGLGEGEPIVTPTEICLNGNAKNGQDAETFMLESIGTADYCKTGRKPYDIIVASILVSVIIHDAGVVESDGTVQDQEWVDAVAHYQSIFGELDDDQWKKVLMTLSM